jgi:hypothetical protein
MTTAPHVGDVHRMVDRLAPPQVEALYVILGGMLGARPASESARPVDDSAAAPKRRLSFIGIMDDERDLAERSSRVLREELGEPDLRASACDPQLTSAHQDEPGLRWHA